MKAYVIWETWLKPEHADKGYEITRAIWQDMPKFKGYNGHLLLRDQDDSTHVLVVSLWETRHDADESKKQYTSQNLINLQPLLRRERSRTVYELKEANNL